MLLTWSVTVALPSILLIRAHSPCPLGATANLVLIRFVGEARSSVIVNVSCELNGGSTIGDELDAGAGGLST
jgi:hypothetical protein